MYGNTRLDAEVKTKDYDPVRTEGDCNEDKLARVLLNGGPIYIFDMYAEDEDDFYGEPALPHEWYGDEPKAMCYKVTLADIEYMLGEALSSDNEKDSYVGTYVRQFMEDPCQVDLPMADAILQYVVFGEVIYD